jgi:hypothetical protein
MKSYVIFLEGNLLKPGNPYCGPADKQPTTNNQPATEELKYGQDRARRRRCPTNKMFEVWQNLAPFGCRPIGGIVEALLTKVVNSFTANGTYMCHLFFELLTKIVS